jgi:hypothetical protein
MTLLSPRAGVEVGRDRRPRRWCQGLLAGADKITAPGSAAVRAANRTRLSRGHGFEVWTGSARSSSSWNTRVHSQCRSLSVIAGARDCQSCRCPGGVTLDQFERVQVFGPSGIDFSANFSATTDDE